jgi:hypothetical protein
VARDADSRTATKESLAMKRVITKAGSALLAAGTLALLAAAPGCLDRPVAPQQPTTVKISTQLYRASKIDKIDLLFMIDNSASMADKQEILANAVGDLVNRLVAPGCIDANGATQPVGGDGKCPANTKREFDPVNDIHIGVLSSSIGGHGADSCADTPTSSYNPRQADMSHLIDRNNATDPNSKEPTWNNKGFLFWDNTSPEKYSPPGDKDSAALVEKFKRIIQGAGQDGCGFEASLESWYRFLVDPAPYVKMVPYSCATNQPAEGGDCRGPDGVDTVVLQQREDFVRPDSLLAVVMVSDENDCSVVDGWQNYIAVQSYAGTMPWHLPRATSDCMANPSTPGCMSCLQGDHSGDPECVKGGYSDLEDSLNLRCYRQKQRFGIDFLYPIRRYVNALSKKTFGKNDVAFPVNPGFLADSTINPLFCPKYKTPEGATDPDPTQCSTVLRDPKLVFLAAIVGVPWQDIAEDPANLAKGYRPVEELAWNQTKFSEYNKTHPDKQRPVPPGVTDAVTVWDQILGKVNADSSSADYLQIDFSPTGEPQDPLMIESVDQRSGTNPATNSQLAGASAGTPTTNPVNGHEWDIQGRNDLQYACIFKIPQRDCTNNPISCDCAEADGMNNPLCQADGGGYGKIQYRAKAYPGRRQLAVLHGLDPNQAIAASICPANTENANADDYGYRPAIGTIIDRLRAVLAGTCWDQKLEYGSDGSVQCIVLEGTKIPEGQTACPACETLPPRTTPDKSAQDALAKDPNYIENGLQCACEIPQAATGAPLTACIESTDDYPQAGGVGVNGWCYVDPDSYKAGTANGNLVLTCPTGAKRMIRFVGTGNPQGGSLTFLQCKGANL